MSNKRVQFRRGTTAEHETTNGGFTGAAGELTVDTTNTSLRVHDNSTAGGVEMARADLENISPGEPVDFNNQRLTGLGVPTQTTDAATKAYVDASFAGGNLSQLTDVTLGTLSSAELIAYSGSAWVNVGVSGDATLAADGALTISEDAIESSMIADGAVGEDQIATGAVTNGKLANAHIDVTDGSNTTGITLGNTITFAATANETTVSQSDGTVTVGLASDVTVASTLTVSGNLIVNGTTTTVNTATVSIQDNIMTLNSDATGTPTENAGLEVERGDSANVALRWNESSDEWEVTPDGTNYYELAHSGNANSVTTAMIINSNVTTDKINADAITNAKIADDAVNTENIADGAITTDLLANASVTTAKIPNNAVTNTKIAADAVDSTKIADNAVGDEHIDFITGTVDGTAGAVFVGNGSSAFAQVAISGDASLAADGALTIANSAVETAMIDDAAVTTVKIGADAVTNAKIADDAVQTENIADNAITTALVNSDAITPAKISFIHDSLTASTDDGGQLLINDGTNGFTNLSVSGDIAIAGSGEATIQAGVVATSMIAADAVTNAKLADDAVETANILDANVTNAKLAANAVATSNITDGNVTAVKLAADSVTTAKIVDANVTTAKLADNAATAAKVSFVADGLSTATAGHFLVTNGTSFTNVALSGDATLASNGAITISNSAVETAMISNSAVTSDKINSEAVITAKIADDAVTTAKIADDNITQALIAAGAIGTTELQADAVTSAKITDSNVTTDKIADGNVTTIKLADANVTTGKIADANVTTAKIANNAVTATQLASSVAGNGLSGGAGTALSVDVDDQTIILNGQQNLALKDLGVSSGKIADSAIGEAKIGSGAVTTSKIASNAITTSLLADSNVTTAKIADGAVTSDKLASSLRNLTFAADSGTADSVALGETISILGTSNEVETTVSNNQITLGLPDNVVVSNNISAGNNVVASNDLTVSGLLNVEQSFDRVRVLAETLRVDNVLNTRGAVTRAVTNASANDTLSLGDSHHIVFFSGSGISLTIPSAVGITGREYVLHNTDSSNSVSVSATGSQLSDTSISSGSLSTSQKITIVSDGTVWREI